MVGKGGGTEDPVGVGSAHRQHDRRSDLSHKCKVFFLFRFEKNLTNCDGCILEKKFKSHRLGL